MIDINQNFTRTHLHIRKRSSNKIKEGLKLYNKEKFTIETIEKDLEVEKELLALMGIETNFGILR